MGIIIKAYIKKASSKAYKPTKRLENFTSNSRGEWALPFPIKFSDDPCRKNQVYGGVEFTGGRVRERSVCVGWEKMKREEEPRMCVFGQERKEIFWKWVVESKWVGGVTRVALQNLILSFFFFFFFYLFIYYYYFFFCALGWAITLTTSIIGL